MFNFFSPKCPIDLWQKAWIEWRWKWLGLQFGWQPMLECQILHPEDIPCCGKATLSHADADVIFDFVAKTLPVNRGRVQLTVLPNDQMPENSTGLYVNRDENSSELEPKSNVYLAESELSSFVSTVSTIAHELAHEALIGQALISGDEEDHEQLTDLLPSYFGYGLFTANNTVETSNWNDGALQYSAWQRKGYLSSLELGHALALFCWLRKESSPAWLSRLRPDAAKTLKASLRYLEQTGDALVAPESLCDLNEANKQKAPDPNPSATHRLASIWDAEDSAKSISRVSNFLSDKELIIRQEALNFLGKLEKVSESTLVELEQSIFDTDRWCQAMATWILAKEGATATLVADSISWLLFHPDESYAAITELAASALAENDSQFLENEKLVDIILKAVARGIPGTSFEESNYELEEEGYSKSAMRLQPTLAAIPNLYEILEERFPDLNTMKIVRFSKHAPFSLQDIDELGF